VLALPSGSLAIRPEPTRHDGGELARAFSAGGPFDERWFDDQPPWSCAPEFDESDARRRVAVRVNEAKALGYETQLARGREQRGERGRGVHERGAGFHAVQGASCRAHERCELAAARAPLAHVAALAPAARREERRVRHDELRALRERAWEPVGEVDRVDRAVDAELLEVSPSELDEIRLPLDEREPPRRSRALEQEPHRADAGAEIDRKVGAAADGGERCEQERVHVDPVPVGALPEGQGPVEQRVSRRARLSHEFVLPSGASRRLVRRVSAGIQAPRTALARSDPAVSEGRDPLAFPETPPRGPVRHRSAFFRQLAFAGARYGPSWFVRYSPPLIGAAFALALPEARREVQRSLRLALGARPPGVEVLDVLRTFSGYAACLAESLGAGRPEARRARVAVRGGEHLNDALRSGRGAVLVTAHIGPWDVAAQLLAADLGKKVAIVMEAEPDADARALHDEVRRSSGVEVIVIGASPLDALGVLRQLRSGGLVAFQIDRPAPNARSLPTTLFGQPFTVPEGPFRLAALAGVPVLPLFSSRSGYFSYEVEIGEPIACAKPATAADLTGAAERTVERMERFIQAHPTEWFHFGGGG
jgi:phosphatidylinositol dimannoside acyltransferase